MIMFRSSCLGSFSSLNFYIFFSQNYVGFCNPRLELDPFSCVARYRSGTSKAPDFDLWYLLIIDGWAGGKSLRPFVSLDLSVTVELFWFPVARH